MKKVIARILALTLALVLGLGALPLAALAEDEDFGLLGSELRAYTGPGGDVVIPDGVQYIKSDVFQDCGASITSLTLPDSLVRLGMYALRGCTALKSITVPGGVTEFQLDAFLGCTALETIVVQGVETVPELRNLPALKRIVLEDGTVKLGNISNCPLLSEIVLPSTLKQIGSFTDLPALTEITIPDSVENYKPALFQYCGVDTASIKIPAATANKFEIDHGVLKQYSGLGGDVTIPEGVTSIAKYAFLRNGSAVESITISEGVTRIDESAFSGCKNLKAVTLPSTLTEIGRYAFQGCTALEYIEFPESLTVIGEGAFSGCTALSGVQLPSGLGIDAADAFPPGAIGGAYTDFQISNGSVTGYTGTGGNIVIPEGVKRIAKRAFAENQTITGVVFPASLETISEDAFWKCSNLTEVTIPANVKKIEGAFRYCTGLKRVVVEEGVTRIDANAFLSCENLTQVTLPGTLKSIGSAAFYGCAKLTDITLPEGLEELEVSSFEGSGIYDQDFIPDAAASNPKYFQIDGAGVLTKYTGPGGHVVIPRSVTRIGDRAFDGKKLMRSVAIPDSVKEIGEYAFSFCTGLETVAIPDSVTGIGDSAFYYCEALKKITVPGSVKDLGERLFCYCTGLTEARLEAGVQTVSKVMFSQCAALKTVTIPNTVTTIESNAFGQCAALESITIPKSVKRIEDGAFSGCTALKTVLIENGVSYIGSGVFEKSGIETITIPASVTETGDWPFRYCENLRSIYLPRGNWLYRGMGMSFVVFTPHLDVIDECPSPRLEAHINYNKGIREAWTNFSCPTQSKRVTEMSNKICAGLETDYEKTEAIAKWVSKNIEYDYDYYDLGLKTYAEVPFTPDEILVVGQGVCAGYARLTQALLAVQGIPCLYVLGGTPSGYHAWNLALVDGRYVWMDNTWGMDYFDRGEAVISIDHWATGGTVFTETTDRVAGRADFTRNAGHLTVEDLIRLTQEENDAMDDIAEDGDDKTDEDSSAKTAEELAEAAAAGASGWAQAEVKAAIIAELVPSDLQRNYTEAITRVDFCRLMVTLVERATGMRADEYRVSKGLPESAGFDDTNSAEVREANALGIVNGRKTGVFDPNGLITRREAAAMLARTAKLLGFATGTELSFTDTDGQPDWAAEGIAFVSGLADAQSGTPVMQGTGNGAFSPFKTYTIQQAILTALRLFHCA